MNKTLLLLSVFISSSLLAQTDSEEPKRQSLALTVYNSNLGVIRDVRSFDLQKGVSIVKLRDVAAQLDPTTVKITSTKHPKSVDVLEQNFEYDLVNQAKLLEKYIDKQITLTDDKKNVTTGTLLSAEGGQLTLSTPTGILMFPGGSQQISVPNLPEGLITKPTLIWQIKSDNALQNEPLEVLYQSSGLNWHAEYIAALADDDKSLDLTGWVSIENTSGTTYPNAKLKVVAGTIHRAPLAVGIADSFKYDSDEESAGRGDFVERGMFEYHLYDLGRATTIKNNEVKQISLMQAEKVKSEKKYTYRGGKNAEVTIEFENTEKNNMGMPLPMGTIRVMKRDKDGSMEFVGEDHIEHTPRDEKLRLKVGDAFDIIGEKTSKDVKSTRHSQQSSIEILIKNHKDEDVVVDDIESLGTSWEILKSSMDYEKLNAGEIVFHVPVKARGETKVTYTVLTTW